MPPPNPPRPNTGGIERTQRLVAELRQRLLDLSNKNRLLNFKHQTRGARQVRVVDESLPLLFEQLARGDAAELQPLPPLPKEPPDEQTAEFIDALGIARLTDSKYLRGLAAILEDDDNAETRTRDLERELRDRMRKKVGLPSRLRLEGPSLIEHARHHGISPSFDLSGSAAVPRRRPERRWQTMLPADELERALGNLAQQAREAREEYGISTLHLVLGFLEWHEQLPQGGWSTQPLRSPLLLLPMEMERARRARHEGYRLRADTEEVEVNLTLRERLRQDFDLDLPVWNAEPHKNAESPDLEAYFSEVERTIRHLPNWKIRRFATITHLSFHRLAMWKDLDPENGSPPPHEHPLLVGLFGGAKGGASSTAAPDDEPHDDPEAGVPILVHDCDASQFAAIRSALRGENLVVQGPPGTGKSQMIANLIAAAMWEGKSVLFVAEKMAALEVVQRRLAAVGLGDYCLELHSAKGGKKAVFESVAKRLDTRPAPNPRGQEALESHREMERDRLLTYSEAVNTPFNACGWTFHEVVWREFAFHARRLPPPLQAYYLNGAAEWDERAISARQNLLCEWETLASQHREQAQAGGDAHPWEWVTNGDLGRLDRDALEALTHESAGRFAELQAWLEMHELNDPACPSLSDAAEVAAGLAALGARPAEVADGLWELCLRPTGRTALKETAAAFRAKDAARQRIQDLAPGMEEALASDPNLLVSTEEAMRRLRLEKEGESLGGLDRREEKNRRHQEQLQEVLATAEGIAKAAQLSVDHTTVEGLETIALYVEWAGAAPDGVIGTGHALGSEGALPKVQTALQEMHAWQARRTELQAHLRVPPESLEEVEVRQAASEMARPGWLAWLRATYRAARKLALRVAPDVPTAERPGFFFDLAAWQHAGSALDARADLREICGEMFQGAGTMLPALEEACAWMEQVREATPVTESSSGLLRHALFSLSADLSAVARRRAGEGWPEEARRLVATAREQGVKLAELRGRLAAIEQDLAGLRRALLALRWKDRLRIEGLRDLDKLRLEESDAAQVLARHEAVAALLAPDVAAQEANAHEIQASLERLRSLRLPARWKQDLAAPAGVAAWRHLLTLGLELGQKVADLHKRLEELSELATSDKTVVKQWMETPRSQLTTLFRAAVDAPAALGTQTRKSAVEAALSKFELTEFCALAWADAGDFRGFGPLFECVLLRSLCRSAFRRIPGLQRFRHLSPAEARDQFRALDEKLMTVQRDALAARVAGRVMPPGQTRGRVSDLSQSGLLRHVANSPNARVSVRSILRRASDALQVIKPCFLMSPLSVAQLVGRGFMTFDMVIFDEASQVRPEDGLSALLRARQMVVVGDNMQLPPTTFGDRAVASLGDDQADDEDANDDLIGESLLDVAAASYPDSKRLLWHYRSRDPALIAFSNQEFYDRRLQLLPAPRTSSPSSGVHSIYVGGVYADRLNSDEARRCAEAAVEFMRVHSGRSLGIVALNRPQADLISAELDRLIQQHPHAQEYRAKWEHESEPLLVKNLENVQGDERDVIFVSTVFGPETAGGPILQRFGPINSKFGHRRLNVLFTRAKHQLVLFTSLRPESVLMGDGKHRGVKVLRDYLEYARTGGQRLPAGPAKPGVDSPFEQSVKDALEAAGYQCDCQVGVAGYFLDLAVRHPQFDRHYLLGIECDGAAYHSSRSARDRDRLRQEALENMGWTIYRVWSTDWFANARGQLSRLLDELKQRKNAPLRAETGEGVDYLARFRREDPGVAGDLSAEALLLPLN